MVYLPNYEIADSNKLVRVRVLLFPTTGTKRIIQSTCTEQSEQQKSTTGPELVYCVCRVGSGRAGCPIYLNASYIIAILVLYADFARKEIRENLPPIIVQLIHSLQCLSGVIRGQQTKRPKPPRCRNDGGCQSLQSRPRQSTRSRKDASQHETICPRCRGQNKVRALRMPDVPWIWFEQERDSPVQPSLALAFD